jgi:superfamily II DNA/RNA helicase
MRDLLARIVPKARIGVAHGQMSSKLLEETMLAFRSSRYDVLLTTSIIESGLDIPTANTIIIDQAHQFGLADLYQLRGRVGRSGRQAFAYLLVPSDKSFTEEAQKRLQAIVEFSQLGAGFRIAARTSRFEARATSGTGTVRTDCRGGSRALSSDDGTGGSNTQRRTNGGNTGTRAFSSGVRISAGGLRAGHFSALIALQTAFLNPREQHNWEL